MSDYVVMPKADWQNILNSARRKAGTSNPIKSGELPRIINSISGGSSPSPSLETAEIYFYNSGTSIPTVYYTQLVDGQMVSTSLEFYETTINAVVGTYITIEGACGWEDGFGILEGIEQNENGCTKWKVINSGNETVYLTELPESGSGSVERLDGYLCFNHMGELSTVNILYGYYDESGSFISQNIVYFPGNVVEVPNPVVGALVILTSGATGGASAGGVEQIDTGGYVFRITGESTYPTVEIWGS